MEIRKIQNTASGSYFVTLPKSWIKDMEIIKGEDLSITQDEEGSLKIKPFRKEENHHYEFIVSIQDYPEENALERCIKSCYVQGSDIIRILSKTTISMENKKKIKDTTVNLIGTEVSEEFANNITIRILVDPVKFPLHNLIKRIYTLVYSMHVDAIKAFQNKDIILAQDVINREKEVDKLFFLMVRQLNLSLVNRVDFKAICDSEMKIDCILGLVLARDLSKMAHYASEIANGSIKLVDKVINVSLKDHLIEMSRFVLKMQQNSILAFFKNDFNRANTVLNNYYQVIEFDHKTENDVLNNINDISIIVGLTTISKNLRSIAGCAFAVSEDLQAKHRPKTVVSKGGVFKNVKNSLEMILSLGYDTEK